MRILVVRRDNIGDLVCTTPLLAALRQRFPAAWIGALVNSYNAAVLDRNPDLDEVLVYRKVKHLDAGDGALGALAEQVRLILKLRRMRLDCVVLATPNFVARNLRFARWLAAKQVLGFSDGSNAAARLDAAVPLADVATLHQVQAVFALAAHFGIRESIPALKVVPGSAETARAAAAFGGAAGRLKVAVQISTRRPAQRWPAERFAALIERLHATHDASCMLLWSPGGVDDPRHPGDDANAAEIVRLVGPKARLVAYPAGPLSELIGALASCDAVVTSDGGAMHLAAGLGKPIVCFFGDMSPERWHPWGVPHRVLRPPSRNAGDIAVEDAAEAFGAIVPVPSDAALRSQRMTRS